MNRLHRKNYIVEIGLVREWACVFEKKGEIEEGRDREGKGLNAMENENE